MNRFSLISPLFILSLIFAFDDNVKVKKEPQKQEQIASYNDIPIPIDVNITPFNHNEESHILL
mgnify:CR=1 FL=1